MVCIAGLPCVIKFNLYNGAKDKNLSNIEFVLNESTRGRDLYDYIQECGQIQPDSFKLYLLSSEVMIDLSEMKDKTMSEIGVDFSYARDSTKSKYTLVVLDSTSTSFCTNSLVQKQVECNLPTYNPPPPSPNHSSVWSEGNVDFKSLNKPEICYVGLVNQAMTCYLNSLLQALYMTPEFRNALYNWEYVEGSEKDEANSIPYQLQKLFLNLQTSAKSAVETTALTKSFGWDSTEAWQQHDIQELCRVMFDALEQKFKNTEQADLINRLYEGKMIDYVKCLECSTEKSREDTFLDIPLPVRPFGSNVAYSSVEEALRAFVQYETLEGNNQYFCEKCNKKCDAHKGLKFTKFPYLLTLHLKRFDFDFKTFHRIKLNDKVTFPDILNLNPFISSIPNQESPSSDENIGLVKCDDSSTTDSGTLDDDYVLCENNLSNSNHSTNHDQDDDEGIDMSNGPSTSNCTVHNHENEKNRNSSSVAKGPYNYELFSIMIHSGSASGGHYYAYIKDFRTQEWLCFNDQSVTQITHDDIQKTYGGGPSRPYRVSSSCANAYMLMYRQIDPVRNALPMQVQDFPKHIQELLKKMKENEDNDRKTRISQHESHTLRIPHDENRMSQHESHTLRMCVPLYETLASNSKSRMSQLDSRIGYFTRKVKVHCIRPNENILLSHRLPLPPDATWAETTKQVYKDFRLEKIVDLDQCRLVAYDEYNHEIVASYEGRENETFESISNNRINSLLLEIRDKDKKFESYPRGIVTKVFIVDVPTRELIEGPIIVRALLTQTVKEYKQMVGKKINIDLSEMEVVLRKHGTDTTLVSNSDVDLQAAGFCNLVNVFMSSMLDTEYKPFFNTAICGIVEELENIITLRIKLPDTSKETLEDLNIPPLEEEPKDKEKPVVSTSPSKVSVNDSNHDAGPKSNEVSKTGKTTEDTPVRNPSPQLGEGEEWNTPEQSNSEDSSLSDSDKTLVGDAPEDDVFQLPYLPSKNRAIKMLNHIGLENWDNVIDDSEYYVKVTPYMSSYRKCLKVLVDKRMTFSTLKKHLEPYVGVRSDYFKIFRYFNESGESQCSLFNRLVSYEDEEELCIKLGRALRNGEFTVKLYQFFIDSPEPYKFLCEWILSEGMQVGQAKKEFLAEIKRKYDIDIPYERCRLRKKCFSKATKVFLDDQKFELPFYPQVEMIIQELPDKEPITNGNQVVLFVRRWSVETMQLAPLQEIVLDRKSAEELYKKLSSISDIPEKHIEVAKAKASFSYTSIVRIQNELEWNETMIDIEPSIQDGAEYIYRDNRETVKNLTREEFSEIAVQEVSRLLPPSSAPRYSARREKALRINLDTE
nr:ubiquitin carboxyl-terminal hydrolase 47 [Osmia lignaria]XP_034183826.1 ubiquitin carboxyl-terminal hydrolase 47 [Osmia lignaria]XP_034183833.1 ubiquitin carboxyl-terminal hydrolase 47 [Osmia lignaria]XP_034183840.1 ubiquitin carboxyl-terminal hydrolase 47 [Osmia lignaria]XP_034183850.1 ubiquitin carboxyl-terminal hydrolase 47 [Osmia lignaria]XP_034183856.1 ubiquitin carboxyl-terminal hydrolase 47 [Osmia lignaria]XP_034183865.1 ubiquitin carboxyl-terminal hydrolase 47 [Osmia lignaria]